MPPHLDSVKITIYWDNESIETFRTRESSVKVFDAGFCIDDAGVKKEFNKQYIRRIDTVEE